MPRPLARELGDVTQPKHQSASPAESLRDKEAFNFALFQHNPAAMVVVDQDGRVIKSNLARRAMEIPLPSLGAPLFDPARGEPDCTLASLLAEAIATGQVRTRQEVSLASRILNFTLAPFPQGAVVIAEDITERQQARADADRRQKQLIQADKMIALGNLVSGVAHEISNPNNVMILGTGVLRRSCDDILRILDHYQQLEGDFEVGRRPYPEIREELPAMVDTIQKAAERIKDLVDDLKAFARKSPETLSETVDLNAVVDAAVHLLNPLLRKACQRVSVNKAAPLPTIVGNARNIEQVVINLLSNACQALPDPNKAIVISTRQEPDTDWLAIEVHDEGAGIAPENLDRITDPFFTTRQDDGGTGLGLSISRTIVENHKGELRFASQLGKGTTVTVRLPIRRTGTPTGGQTI